MESSPLLQKPPMPSSVISRLRMRDAGRYLVGVLLLLSVVFLWTASNFITANLETGQGGWNKPFLITYFNTASFTIYLLPTIWRRYRSTRSSSFSSPQHINTHDHDHDREHLLHAQQDRLSQSDTLSISRLSLSRRSRSPSPCVPPSPRVAIHSLDLDRHLEDLPENTTLSLDIDVETTREGEVERLSMKETAEIAALWSIVWFVANWAVNASLAWTSVASVTVLSSTSGFFTLALGRICGVEDLTRTKIFAVVASFLGVLLVTHSDSSLATTTFGADSTSHALFGDALALLSAGCYAVYVILLKVRVVDEDRADMQLMLGFAGLFNTIALIPIFPILHYLKWETFELPPTKSAWIICLINFCITLSSDYLYVLAMLKTTPMLVTIGLSLTIPLALIGSVLLPSIAVESITIWSLLGASLVFVGFGILGWQGYNESRDGDSMEDQEEGNGLLEDERGRSTNIR